jgi:hypothetical protein
VLQSFGAKPTGYRQLLPAREGAELLLRMITLTHERRIVTDTYPTAKSNASSNNISGMSHFEPMLGTGALPAPMD